MHTKCILSLSITSIYLLSRRSVFSTLSEEGSQQSRLLKGIQFKSTSGSRLEWSREINTEYKIEMSHTWKVLHWIIIGIIWCYSLNRCRNLHKVFFQPSWILHGWDKQFEFMWSNLLSSTLLITSEAETLLVSDIIDYWFSMNNYLLWKQLVESCGISLSCAHLYTVSWDRHDLILSVHIWGQ